MSNSKNGTEIYGGKKNRRKIKSQVEKLIQKDTPKLMNESKNTHASTQTRE